MSRLANYVSKILKEDMLHQFGCYAELRNLSVHITLPTMELGDRQYPIALFLECLTGKRPVVRTLCYHDEQISGPSLFMTTPSSSSVTTAGMTGRRKSNTNISPKSTSSGNVKKKSASEEYRKLSGPASGISFMSVLQEDDMFHFLEKLRQLYLP